MEENKIHRRLNIIARFNEDLSWAENLQGDVIVYDKGENYNWTYVKKESKNIGRESETYIRAIIDHYEWLDQYDDFVFLQGYPLDHCPNLFEMLNFTTNVYAGLGSNMTNHKIPANNYILNTHKFVVDILCQQMKRDHNLEMSKIASDFSFLLDHGDGRILEKNHEIKQIMYILQILEIPYKGLNINWINGAQYIVDTDLLKQKSLSWWKNLHELIRYWSENIDDTYLPYILERIWPVIWTHRNHYGGWIN